MPDASFPAPGTATSKAARGRSRGVPSTSQTLCVAFRTDAIARNAMRTGFLQWSRHSMKHKGVVPQTRLTRFTREAWHDFLPFYLAMLKLEDSLANADTTVSPRCAIKELICTSVVQTHQNTALQCHWQTYRHPGSARAIRSLLQRNQGPLCISSPTRHLKRACTSCKLFTA